VLLRFFPELLEDAEEKEATATFAEKQQRDEELVEPRVEALISMLSIDLDSPLFEPVLSLRPDLSCVLSKRERESTMRSR